MHFQRKTERLDAERPEDLLRAAALLRSGETVAFPTETVYGLGANALSAGAVEQIFVAKQRPHWDPLIVHVADRAMLERVAAASALEEPLVKRLIEAFWPGPLTLLLARTPEIPDAVTAGRALVGVRMPAHPVALGLIQAAGVPVAAPSANRFGHTSPTSAAHVLDDLDGRIDAVLDGGSTRVGVESTVAAVTGEGVRIYRPGAVTLGMLEDVAGVGRVGLYVAPEVTVEEAPESLPSPGVGMRHYAPRARLVLVEVPTAQRFLRVEGFAGQRWSPRVPLDPLPPWAILAKQARAAVEQDRTVGVMLPEGWDAGSEAPIVFPWGSWDQPEVLAQRLFAGLRRLDESCVEVIFCPLPPGEGIAAAIRDRLRKGAREQ